MTWLKKIEQEYKESINRDLEKVVFTAEKGSLLDRIWNKTFNKTKKLCKQRNKKKKFM